MIFLTSITVDSLLDKNVTSLCILLHSTLDYFQGHFRSGFRRTGRMPVDSLKSYCCGWLQFSELEDILLWILLSLGFDEKNNVFCNTERLTHICFTSLYLLYESVDLISLIHWFNKYFVICLLSTRHSSRNGDIDDYNNIYAFTVLTFTTELILVLHIKIDSEHLSFSYLIKPNNFWPINRKKY